MKIAANIGNRIVGLITAVVIVALLLYGGLMLRDTLLTDVRAFASFDLMQYRPNIEEDEPPYLDELFALNPDTTGWITIYNTNIDYPVMQGETDMEYINKDVYGEYTVTGSIFMASENSKDYSDPYTLLYGHHMTNGAMFGDLPKFKDETFFNENKTGILIRDAMAYDLEVMAFLETDAYEEEVYKVDKTDTADFVPFLREKATFFRDVPYEKILALSTCNDANTAGRTVLVCAMNVRTAPLPGRESGEPAPRRKAMGHPLSGKSWGLLTLVGLLVVLFFIIRAVWKGRGQRMYARMLGALAIGAAATVLFILAENLRNPMQMVDAWTPVMILALVGLRLLLVRTGDEKEENETESTPKEVSADA